jgi:putative ABC transport system permease protein
MRPDDNDIDEEIRSHIAISVRERIERGEDPDAARRAAWQEFGYVPAVRDSMRRVWYSRWFDAVAALGQDMRVGVRSLMRARGLAATIVITLALGIGANVAIFSVVREVLLRPLVNRDQDRLIYIRQSAKGLNAANMTFSVPEIEDFKARTTTISTFGDFSTVEFTMVGLGEPRVVKAGVVSGSFFEVMGLRPHLGRLINQSDDGPDARAVAVLTYRFWSSSLGSDPSVIGRTLRLGSRNAVVVGVLEPSVPYPAETEIIANVVSSPHHLSATMVTQRTHRMTELFGRLAPGVTLETARADLAGIHEAMIGEHPDSYSAAANMQLSISPLRDQIAAPARTVLIVLLAAAGVVFVIACSNVANLILARSVRREGELAIRAALGASAGALRRTLLAESLVLCGAGAALGVLLASPFVDVVSRYAARFSIRALDVTIDASLLWLGAGLAMAAAVVLAFVPRLPSSGRQAGERRLSRFGAASSGVRITPGTNRRLRVFAVTQIACSFILLAGAGALLTALLAQQRAPTGYNMTQVLAVDIPTPSLDLMGVHEADLAHEILRRVGELPGVQGAALGNVVPWRDAGRFGPGTQFAAEGYTPPNGEENPFARLRIVSPGFFDVIGISVLAGRDFTDADRRGSDPVVIVSSTVARQLFGEEARALDRKMWWTDPYFGKPQPRRIIGVVEDADDESVVQRPAMAVYHPVAQLRVAGRLFVHSSGDPYALVSPVTRIIHELSADQPVERPATLDDVRSQVLAPERLNAFVFSGFAGVALLIAVVGVAGVLAFSVSARTREFGVRLAVGATPRRLLMDVLRQGAGIVLAGIAAGITGGYALSFSAAAFFEDVHVPGVLPVLAATALLGGAAILASFLPAVRAARVNLLQALRPE